MFFRHASFYLLVIFVPLWMVHVKAATPAILGISAVASMISALLLQVPAGKLADKYGRKKIFFLLNSFYCLGIFILITAPTSEYLVLASIFGGFGGIGASLGGGIGGTASIPLITLFWEAVPVESRGKLYGLDGIISASSRIPISIIGGLLWDQGFKMQVMLIPALTELLLITPILYITSEKAQ